MRALFFALFAAMSFSLAAENVWTLGEYDKRLGWALISGDGKVTLRLEGDVKSDLSGECRECTCFGGKLFVFLLGSDACFELVCPSRKMGGECLHGNLLSRALYSCVFDVF